MVYFKLSKDCVDLHLSLGWSLSHKLIKWDLEFFRLNYTSKSNSKQLQKGIWSFWVVDCVSGCDAEMDLLYLDLHVTYRDVIVFFYDRLYQLKYFELQRTLQSYFACSSHTDPDLNNNFYHFV